MAGINSSDPHYIKTMPIPLRIAELGQKEGKINPCSLGKGQLTLGIKDGSVQRTIARKAILTDRKTKETSKRGIKWSSG